MYASCTRCDLRTCIQYKKNKTYTETQDVHVVELAPGLVMIDTGCRAAVGGRSWHRALQKCLEALGKEYYSTEQLEYFQFGPGEPIRSTRRWHYQVGIQGVNRWLIMSEVLVECPGLIGPSELTAWHMLLDFVDKTFSSEGVTTPIIFARSGHPCMSLLEYGDESVELRQADPDQVYQLDVLETENQDALGEDSELETLLEKTSAKAEYYDIAGGGEGEEDDLNL
jgi:hypothetical protein